MRYTFGDSEIAIKRLELIARFFNEAVSDFILKNLKNTVNQAIDLGCGPGFTTNMLSEVTKAPEIYGLDVSESFIEYASKKFNKLKFIKHDITKLPFPVKGDIMYSRFLLSHLKNIQQVIEGWVKELNEEGIIVIDELEDINTDIPVFQKYIEVNEGLIKSQGAELFIGKYIGSIVKGLNVVKQMSEELPVYNWQAASWFYPNTKSIWEEEDFVLKKLTEKERGRISEKLLEIMANDDNISNITWRMKRIVIKK